MQYGFAFAGLILFCYLTAKKKYSIPFKKELYIPKHDLANVMILNPGIIVFAVLTLAQFVLSIL